MWWGCVSVGALRWALPGQTASLWLPACVCRCLCPALSQLFVYAAGQLGENGALLDPVTVFPLHPKSGPCASFVLPQCCCFFVFFIPNCNLILASYSFFFFTTVRDVWRADCGCLLKAGCSLTLLLGPISAPEGLLNCPRFSVRRRGRGKDRKEGGAVTMLALIKLVRNEFPVSKHMQ